MVIVLGISAMTLVLPTVAWGKIATVRTRIVEVHPPGSEKGMKFGAITLAWGEGAKPELRTVGVRENTKMTAVGKDGRAPVGLKDLKPGMTVVSEMSANRIGDTSWKLDVFHVLDPAKPPDQALVKLLGSLVTTFVGSVARIGPPAAERKEDVGQIELQRGKNAFTFFITKDTQIVRQAADGKQQPATFNDFKTGSKVVVRYPGPLATGNPPQAPATLVIILETPK